MSEYNDLAKAIIEAVGGPTNINSVVHCATRGSYDGITDKLFDI
ncbi:PTS transporter subunit EIIB, partial [Latilactobacillus sakei]